MRRIFAIVPIVVLAVAAAGCGSSSKSSSQATTSTASSSSGGSTTSSASSASSSSTASSSSSSSSSFATTKNCSQLVTLGSSLSKSLQAQSASGTTSLQAQANIIKQAAGAAPAAIRSDIETLADAYAGYAAKLKSAGFKPGSTPTATQLAALAGILQQLSSPKVKAAVQHVEAWAKKNCNG